MEQGDLADQLSLVQQMVMEMKQGFSSAMEELSKIQYGDQTLQQQLADNKKECAAEVKQVTEAVEELKTQVQSLSGQIERVSDAQRTLQEKIECYQTDREILLEELEKYGLITDQLRLRLAGEAVLENNNNLPDVAPMVHPYLNSIQNHPSHKGPEDQYNEDASLTAAVTRSLSLTQALGEKCQHLDASIASSDEEDNSRHSQSHSGSGHKPPMRRHGSFNYEDGVRSGLKIPPHEQVLEEVHREEAARDIVDSEREYCTQIWSLVDNFMNPLREEEIVSLKECNTLFPAYIPLIYEQHCIMLRKLEERMRKWKFSGVIGDVFAKLTDSQDGDGLLLYQAYINDFPTIINCMNKWFAQSPQFCEVMQCYCLANSPVLPLLLAPLQQIPKYSLLLKNLLKYTPCDHPDRYYLESSLYKLKSFLNTMNDDLEHAMNVLNINRDGISRSRESGNSARSRSSGSSTEVNHMSSTRDSGVHSSGEERPKSPLSPNTTRRFVLQVLRERREKGGNNSPVKADHHPSTPRGHNHSSYGSHPDLTYNIQGHPDGRTSPYLATLPHNKPFSSLSKLPLPHEKSKRVRVGQKHDVHRPGINTNYLRPLTPQMFPTSTSAHSFDSMRRREEMAERARLRPASAVEISADETERLERYQDLLGYRATSPTRHSVSTVGSDRSRKEMQKSLQKLLAETGHSIDDISDNEQEKNMNENTYHKQFLATKDRILRKGSGKDKKNLTDHSNRLEKRHSYGHTRGHSLDINEDYGIYGEDDDIENLGKGGIENEAVKPMQLLPDSHRPKIMVPKWRQNAPLQPPNYNTSVEMIQKQNGYSSEENLAVSLAQSLMDSPASNSDGTIDNRRDLDGNFTSNTLPRKNLKRKEASGRKSPRTIQSVPLAVHPTTENEKAATHQNNEKQTISELTSEGESAAHQLVSSSPTSDHSSEMNGRRGSGVNTALIDVIAYTADCLERSDSNKRINDPLVKNDRQDSEGSNSNHTSEQGQSHIPFKEIAQVEPDHSQVKMPSIPNSDSVSETSVIQSLPTTNGMRSESHNESHFTNISVPASQEKSVKPVNTDQLLYYFQNRNSNNHKEDQVDVIKTNDVNLESDVKPPAFHNKYTTSTPTSEAKSFAFNPEIFSAKSNVGRKDRLVRADQSSHITSKTAENDVVNTERTVEPGLQDLDVTSDKTNGEPDKEKVLRAVDRIRMSFERPRSLDIPKSQNQSTNSNRPLSTDSSQPKMPLILKTFTLPQKGIPKENKTEDHTAGSAVKETNASDQHESTHRMYRKAGGLKSPTKHLGEATATARQIQKLERSASPPVKTNNTDNGNFAQTERTKSPVSTYMHNSAVKAKRGVSPQRFSNEGSHIPQRSGSPVRSISRPLSAEASIDPLFMQNGDNSQPVLKSAMKDTKIPVLRKSGSASGTNQLSKSTEDISKMKKKSAFKDSLKNIFGRKNMKAKKKQQCPS